MIAFPVNKKMPNIVDDYFYKISSKDFARMYLFRVLFTFPSNTENYGFNALSDVPCYVKSTTLPDTAVEETSRFYMGQQYKLSSVRRFTDWVVTLYIDKSGSLLKTFYEWNRMCQSKENKAAEPEPVNFGYMVNMSLDLLNSKSPNDMSLRVKLNRVWPKSITNVSLDYESNEFITMDVTFTYQTHDIILGNITGET